MLQHIKVLLKDKALYIAIAITIAIAILSLVKIDPKVGRFSSADKLYHSIAYFFLTFFWLLFAISKESFKTLYKYLILGCVFYGTVLEVFQGQLTSYRTASFLDMVANSVGVFLAALIFNFFEKKNQFN